MVFNQTAYGHKRTYRKKIRIHTYIEQYVTATEKEYGLPKSLLSAVIAQESSYHTRAVNYSTNIPSYGLGQITLPTAKSFCKIKTKSELFQHDKNIHCTAKILKHHIVEYGSIHSALAAYRAGTPCKRKYSRKHRICTKDDEQYISSVVRKKAAMSL